jgi:mannose-1-phosphate guanylyltransferase
VALKKVIDAFVTDICKLDLFTGTRFRPLSLDIPKPLFPVAGLPLIQHHIEACIALKELKEILLIGFYPAALIQQFVNDLQHRYNVTIR